MKRWIIPASLVSLMIAFLFIISALTVASAEISEQEFTTPEIPPYSSYDFELKPTANAFIGPAYSFYSRIEYGEFYDYSRGVIKFWLENTGDNTLFVYKYGVQTEGLPGGGWIFSETGLTIYPGEKKYIGMVSVYIGGDIGSFSVKQGFGLMAKTDDGRWYDYETVFVDESTEISVSSIIAEREPTYQVNRGGMFRQLNMVIFPIESHVRNIAIQTAKKYPGKYNIYQVCSLFDYTVNNIKYVSDPKGFDYQAKPSETVLAGGGDCDDYAILLSALIESIGGTPRIYLTEDHMFAAVYIGDEKNVQSMESAIGEYYNTPIIVHYLTDESGTWLLLDSTSSYYAGGLPGGAKPTRTGWTFENATNISVIDITPYFEEIKGELNLSDIIFCSLIRGEKDYDQKLNATYDSGDMVWMYTEILNFDTKKQDGTYEVWIKQSLIVCDSNNKILQENLDYDEFHESLSTVSDFIWTSGWIDTSNFQSDHYKVELTVKDMISGESKSVIGYFIIATAPEMPGFESVVAIMVLSTVAYLLRKKKL